MYIIFISLNGVKTYIYIYIYIVYLGSRIN